MDLTFFSFISIDGGSPEDHRNYNEWHQLDHLPENRALPGVAWGDRWARIDTGTAPTGSDPRLAGTDYVAMYWFRDPVSASLHAWDRLGEDSFQWGRGPLIPGVRRPMLSFFRPVKGYSEGSTLVAPSVLPYRPNRGIHVTVTRFSESHGAATHAHHQFEDRFLLPQLMDLDGVAGAWTFSFAHHQQHHTLPFATSQSDAPGSMRIRVTYLDADPIDTTGRIVESESCARRTAGLDSDAAEVVFTGAFRTIVPWQDW